MCRILGTSAFWIAIKTTLRKCIGLGCTVRFAGKLSCARLLWQQRSDILSLDPSMDSMSCISWYTSASFVDICARLEHK